MSAVRVNEVKIFATRTASEWWTLFQLRGPSFRFVTVMSSIAGELVDVACDDREHAEWLMADMIEQGIPRSALKVIR